jgi:hypothetical protein
MGVNRKGGELSVWKKKLSELAKDIMKDKKKARHDTKRRKKGIG